MLCLNLNQGEYLTIGEDVVVQLDSISGDRCKLVINAPKEIAVLRGKVLERNGFRREETFVEDGVESAYFLWRRDYGRIILETERLRLRELEEAGSPQLDRAADAFAGILACAAQAVSKEGDRRALCQLLYHLGRWIYLADARDDLEEDKLAGRYNPVAARYGPEGDDSALRLTMDLSLEQMGAALQLGDFGCRRPLLENIIYLGLPLVERAVFDGSWRELKKQKIWGNDT